MKSAITKFSSFISLSIFISSVLAFGNPECHDVFSNLDVGHTHYAANFEVTSEKVLDRQIEIVRFPSLNYYKKYYSFDLSLKEIISLSWGDIFMKMIRPALINDYVVYRYKLSDMIQPMGNEVLIGFDRNHTYLLLRDEKTGKYTRADSGTDVEFKVTADAKSVSRGLFLRFANTSEKDLTTLQDFVKEDRKYMTCTHGVCSALSQVGVQFGSGGPAETTYKLIEYLLKKEIQIKDPNVVFDVFTIDPRSLGDQVGESLALSKTNEVVRQKGLKGWLIVGKSLGKTFKYWFFNKVGLLEDLNAPQNP